MIKRIFHVFVAIAFTIFVLIELLIIVLFTDSGFGKKWISDSKEMIDILHDNIK